MCESALKLASTWAALSCSVAAYTASDPIVFWHVTALLSDKFCLVEPMHNGCVS